MIWQAATIFLSITVVVLVLWERFRFGRLQQQISDLTTAASRTLQQHRELEEQAKAERQTLFNSMGEGVILLDQSGRIQLVNQSLERQFALVIDVRGYTLTDALHLPELDALMGRLRNERRVLSCEVELPGKEMCYLEVNAALVFDREGESRGAIFVCHDLTRIRQLENTRREFVANVSHELRTPLSLIKGYVETLLDGAKDDPETAARFLQTIERHSNRLNNLIEDLLTISRLESGQITLNLQTIPLREFAGTLLEEMRGRATEKKVILENQIPKGLEGRADPDRLEQVLVNLVENAIKYGRAGGRALLRGRAIEGGVELCVADDGPGIPAQARERIFERFYRVDRARSRESGGTGLGLAIVKHIVQSHGGKVWVESEPGQGARFYFTLPLPGSFSEGHGAPD